MRNAYLLFYEREHKIEEKVENKEEKKEEETSQELVELEKSAIKV